MVVVLEGYEWVAEVVEVGWQWVDAAISQTLALASAPIGEECQRYIATLRASPALY
jgi:hypothetical protein